MVILDETSTPKETAVRDNAIIVRDNAGAGVVAHIANATAATPANPTIRAAITANVVTPSSAVPTAAATLHSGCGTVALTEVGHNSASAVKRVLWRRELPVMCGFCEVVVPMDISTIIVTHKPPLVRSSSHTKLTLSVLPESTIPVDGDLDAIGAVGTRLYDGEFVDEGSDMLPIVVPMLPMLSILRVEKVSDTCEEEGAAMIVDGEATIELSDEDDDSENGENDENAICNGPLGEEGEGGEGGDMEGDMEGIRLWWSVVRLINVSMSSEVSVT